MNAQIILDHVTKPALEFLGSKYNSLGAQQLDLITKAVESDMCNYIKQINGPALGCNQIEPDTHLDLYLNYLKYKPELLEKVKSLLPDRARGSTYESMQHRHNELKTNMFYSTVISRLIYYRYPEKMPSIDDKEGMFYIYKKRFNSSLGATDFNKFSAAWDKHLSDIKY